MRRVAAITTGLAAMLVLTAAPPAWAESGQADASTEGDRITAEASYEATPAKRTASRSKRSTTAPRRVSFQLGGVRIDAVGVGNGCAHLSTPAVPNAYARVCRHDFERASPFRVPFFLAEGVYYRVEPRSPGPPPPALAVSDLEGLALQARESLALPAPRIAMNPRADWESLVNLPTWLWVEGAWAEQEATATAGPVSAVARARPEAVVWDMGNGERVTCPGPGVPYDPTRAPEAQDTDCSYTYPESSAGQPGDAYRVTATVVWRASWSATGAEGGGDLGTLTTSDRVAVRVAELQALNT